MRLLTWWLICGLSLGLAQPAGAGEMRLGNVVPGAGVIHKSMLSLREARYVDLVPQSADFSCGAAALATILKYGFGREATEQQVLREMLEIADPDKVVRLGFSLLDMKNYAQKLGMKAAGIKIAPENLEKLKVPTIVLLDIKGYKHFAVLKKVKGDNVYLGDPALGNNVMKMKDFVPTWNGIVFAMVGEGYDKDTVLRRPREPASARNLLTQRAPIVNAEIFEFGILHADLF